VRELKFEYDHPGPSGHTSFSGGEMALRFSLLPDFNQGINSSPEKGRWPDFFGTEGSDQQRWSVRQSWQRGAMSNKFSIQV